MTQKTWSPRFTTQQLKHLQQSSRFNMVQRSASYLLSNFLKEKTSHVAMKLQPKGHNRRFPTSHTMLQRAFLHRGIWFVSSDPESWLSSTSARTRKIDTTHLKYALHLQPCCYRPVAGRKSCDNWPTGKRVNKSLPHPRSTAQNSSITSFPTLGKEEKSQEFKTVKPSIDSRWFDMIQLMVSTSSNPWKIRNQGTNQWFKAPLCQSLRIWGEGTSVSFDMKNSPCDMQKLSVPPAEICSHVLSVASTELFGRSGHPPAHTNP